MRKKYPGSSFTLTNRLISSAVAILGFQLFTVETSVASPAFIEPRFKLVCEDEDRDGFGWNGVCVCDAQLRRQLQTTEIKITDNRLGMLWTSPGASYLDCDVHGLSIYEKNDNGIWSNKADFYDLPAHGTTDIAHLGQDVFSYLSYDPDNRIYDYDTGYSRNRILNIVRRNEEGAWQKETEIFVRKSYIYELDNMVAGSSDDAVMYQEYTGRNGVNPLIAHFYDNSTNGWVRQVINDQPGELYKDFVISGNRAAAFAYSSDWWHPSYIVVFERDTANQWRETTRLRTDYFTRSPLAFGDTLVLDGDTIVTTDSAKGLYSYTRQPDGQWTRAPDSTLEVERTYRGYPSYRSRRFSLAGDNLLLAEYAAKSILQQNEYGVWVPTDSIPRQSFLDRFELPYPLSSQFEDNNPPNFYIAAIGGGSAAFSAGKFVLIADLDQQGRLSSTVNGCDYSNADAYGGWGWNASLGQSCEPLASSTDLPTRVDDNCNYSYASLHDGWGWNAETQESCPPVTAPIVNDTPVVTDTSGNCDYSDADQNAGWGWDPVVRQACVPLSAETQCVDSDGDGWGWDGLKSCIPGG